MRVAPRVTVADEHIAILQGWARGRSTPVRLMHRARIVLLASQGRENKDIAVQIGVTRQLVGRWRTRFVQLGLDGIIKDAPGRGPKERGRNNFRELYLIETAPRRTRRPIVLASRRMPCKPIRRRRSG